MSLLQGGGVGTIIDSAQLQFVTNTSVNAMRIDTSGNVGIGTTTPASTLQTVSALTTANANTFTANSLTIGNLLYLTSTSTALSSGGLLSLDWTPGSSTTTTGDLLSVNIGPNGTAGNLLNIKDNGSSLFSVSETAVTSNLPSSFTSSGDVSIAYDLLFTNQTSSFIKSNAPITIEAGESFESNDLTLKTYNNGDVVLDSPGGVTLTQAQAWDLANSSTTSLNIESGLMDFDTTNSRIGIGTTTPTAKLDIAGDASSSGSLVLRGTSPTTIDILNGGRLDVQTSVGGDTGLTSRLTLTNAGNVGIGTTTPATGAKLDVQGAVRLGANGNANDILNTTAGSAPSGNLYWGSRTLCDSSNNCTSTTTVPWDKLTNPGANLSLSMTTYTTTFTWGSATGASTNLFNLTDTSSNTGTGYLLNVTTASSSSLKPFHVSAAGTEAIYVNASGNIGIGTTAPNTGFKMDVNGAIRGDKFTDAQDSVYYVDPASGSTLTELHVAGSTPVISGRNAADSAYNTLVLKGSTTTTDISVCIEGTGTGGNCDGKIDAGTVDPPYTINGKKYATYMASIIGMK